MTQCSATLAEPRPVTSAPNQRRRAWRHETGLGLARRAPTARQDASPHHPTGGGAPTCEAPRFHTGWSVRPARSRLPAPRCPPQSCARDDDCTQAPIPAANRSTAVTGDSAQRNHTADTPGPAHAACTRQWWRAGRALTTMFMAWTSILNKCCPCEETLSPGGAARGSDIFSSCVFSFAHNL